LSANKLIIDGGCAQSLQPTNTITLEAINHSPAAGNEPTTKAPFHIVMHLL